MHTGQRVYKKRTHSTSVRPNKPFSTENLICFYLCRHSFCSNHQLNSSDQIICRLSLTESPALGMMTLLSTWAPRLTAVGWSSVLEIWCCKTLTQFTWPWFLQPVLAPVWLCPCGQVLLSHMLETMEGLRVRGNSELHDFLIWLRLFWGEGVNSPLNLSRISRSRAMTEFTVKSLTLLIWQRLYEALLTVLFETRCQPKV